MKRKTAKERLLDGIEIITESGCWIWMKAVSPAGYGKISYLGKNRIAHRVSYMEFIGGIPGDLCALHRCDTPSCINPNHLFLGTKGDNNRDAMRKGRCRSGSYYREKGDWNCNVKLTKEQVLYIRASDETQIKLAKKFNVSRATIGDARTRKTWRYV